MRAASIFAVLACQVMLAIALGAPAANAGARVLHVDQSSDAAAPAAAPPAGFQSYRGYIFDLSQDADRKDSSALVDNLKHQLDIVDKVGLSPRVLKFFHSIPIIASETECLEIGAGWACYGLIVPDRDRHGTDSVTTWDHDKQQWTNPDPVELAVDSGLGVIVVRPYIMTYADEPILLHEFLHAYHARLMPQGFDNLGVKAYYAEAKTKNLLPKKAYAMFNHKEFFAVTGSIFLFGKDSVHDPFTRAKLKEKMPDYYKYLVAVFGIDPEQPNGVPVASSETDTGAPTAQADADAPTP